MLLRHGSNAMIQSKVDLRTHRGGARLARVAGFKRTSGMLMSEPNISNTVLKTLLWRSSGALSLFSICIVTSLVLYDYSHP